MDLQIYMAAMYTNGYRTGSRYERLSEFERKVVWGVPHLLESYHYIHRQRFVDQIANDEVAVFLDSGAFSAWTMGVEINLPDYCDYIQRNDHIVRKEDGVLMASVLDGIGDPLKTWQNQKHMEHLGVKPLPCFHFGEDERYLDYYLENYEYITIGGMVGKSAKTLATWLDRIWDKHMISGSGKPKIKVHGFGLTSLPLMKDYPWYSVDSSSWVQSAAFGSILTPTHGVLCVSDKSPARHDAGRHVTTLTAIEQDYVYKMLEEQGFTFERLSTIYEARAAYNLWSFGVINATINAAKSKTYAAAKQELF